MYGLINLAGRQLLPNILASLAFSRTEQLRQNAVLHSDNRLESDLPAQRLFELLERDAASGCVELLRIEVDETLQGVTDEVLALFAEFPGLRWILHATGGNKMMSAALVDLARHPLVAAVVYRDIVKGWHQVTAQPDGALVESPVTRNSGVAACLLDPQVRLDSLPLPDLLRAQFAENTAIARVDGSEPLSGADPEGWIGDVGKHSTRSFVSYLAGRLSLASDGAAFEAWLCSVISMAGARQVLWNCNAFNPDGGPALECDVVALHGDRIAVYDAKLDQPKSKGKTEQIRAAAKTAQDLGGLSATAVVVRPNWPRSPGTRSFADAMKVRLVTSEDAHDFVRQLLVPLGLQDSMRAHAALNRIQVSLDAIFRHHPQHPFIHEHAAAIGRSTTSPERRGKPVWPRGRAFDRR